MKIIFFILILIFIITIYTNNNNNNNIYGGLDPITMSGFFISSCGIRAINGMAPYCYNNRTGIYPSEIFFRAAAIFAQNKLKMEGIYDIPKFHIDYQKASLLLDLKQQITWRNPLIPPLIQKFETDLDSFNAIRMRAMFGIKWFDKVVKFIYDYLKRDDYFKPNDKSIFSPKQISMMKDSGDALMAMANIAKERDFCKHTHYEEECRRIRGSYKYQHLDGKISYYK